MAESQRLYIRAIQMQCMQESIPLIFLRYARWLQSLTFVDNVVPAEEVRGIKIDEAFLGSCNNGRIEDLRVGASIIKGKKVAEKVRFLVVPASQTVYRQALKEGLIDIFMEAGAIVMNPNCSVCWGSCQGVIGENEVLISTGTRNFKGRAGHPSSKVYLGSAATVTAFCHCRRDRSG